MDLKELVNKINESLVEEKVSEDINNPYTVQEFHSDISDAINALTEVQEKLAEEDEDFEEASLDAVIAAENLLKCANKFRTDFLELKDHKWESVNEAQIEKAPFNEGKIVKSDMLNFGIGINPTKDGFVLGPISYGNQIQPFRKEGATQEEVIDVVNRVASIVENHIDDIEYAIGRIGENFGFRK